MDPALLIPTLHAHHDDLMEFRDGLHCNVEPAAVDIVELKRNYGDRLSLLGNIDLPYTLTDVEESEKAERQAANRGDRAPNRRYIIASENSIPSHALPENLKAMSEAIEVQLATSKLERRDWSRGPGREERTSPASSAGSFPERSSASTFIPSHSQLASCLVYNDMIGSGIGTPFHHPFNVHRRCRCWGSAFVFMMKLTRG